MKFNLSASKQNEQDVEWVSWSTGLKKVGDEFELEVRKISFNEEKSCFYLIGEEKAISVFCTNHPDSKYPDSTPHGVRLANAIGRHLALEGEVDVDALIGGLELPVYVFVSKTEQGVLWSIGSEE